MLLHGKSIDIAWQKRWYYMVKAMLLRRNINAFVFYWMLVCYNMEWNGWDIGQNYSAWFWVAPSQDRVFTAVMLSRHARKTLYGNRTANFWCGAKLIPPIIVFLPGILLHIQANVALCVCLFLLQVCHTKGRWMRGTGRTRLRSHRPALSPQASWSEGSRRP